MLEQREIAQHATAFAHFGQATRMGGVATIPHEANILVAAVGAPLATAEMSYREALDAAVFHAQAPDALRLACTSNQQVLPRTAEELGPLLFPNAPRSKPKMQ